jgi:hypothetical protein
MIDKWLQEIHKIYCMQELVSIAFQSLIAKFAGLHIWTSRILMAITKHYNLIKLRLEIFGCQLKKQSQG